MKASWRQRWFGCVWSMLLPLGAFSEPSDAPVETSADVPASSTVLLPAGTEVHLRMLEAVASHSHRRGDHFKLEVAQPVMVNDREIIPVGALADGEVIHAAKPGMAGRAGELILTVRYVQVKDQKIKLRSFSAGTGKDRYSLAAGLGVSVGLPALFVTGKNFVVPIGTDVSAKVAVDFSPSSALQQDNTETIDHVQYSESTAGPH